MYLVPADYRKQIQDANLQQVINNDAAILTDAENAAIEEVKSYLVQKFAIGNEFRDVLEWDKTAATYGGGQRVYLTAPAFSATATYVAGAYVVQSGTVYRAIGAISAGAFNASQWTAIAPDNTLYYAKLPAQEFDLYGFYKVGNTVFFEDRTYAAALATLPIGRPPSIQYVRYDNVPAPNRFPEFPAPSGAQWTPAPSAYAVPANTEIDNTAYWVRGDNRSQQLKMYVVDMTLYHVHSRIAPRNIPELREIRYEAAVSWLKNCAKGLVTLINIPLLQPKQGRAISWGGNIKNKNSY